MSDQIRDLLQTINSSWLSERPEELSRILADCFHPDMVIKDCDLEIVAKGKDACVRSYVDFIQQAKISAFSQDDADIHVVGETAIATYGWKITYTLEGKEYTEPGHDVFVFSRADGKWLAVWRAMLTEPAE
jgi:ketosteroid isomerase-like protein